MGKELHIQELKTARSSARWRCRTRWQRRWRTRMRRHSNGRGPVIAGRNPGWCSRQRPARRWTGRTCRIGSSGNPEAAGLPAAEIRFYDLRHSAPSMLLAAGVPVTDVSAMLGHALVSTTLNVYAHVLPGAERVTADAMERLLG
ncbi:MAG: tyrosine-type recombinase/integrase [Thermomicrobiales bacterium]